MQGEGLKKLQSGQPISTREQLLLIAQLSWPAILRANLLRGDAVY